MERKVVSSVKYMSNDCLSLYILEDGFGEFFICLVVVDVDVNMVERLEEKGSAVT